MQPLCHDDDSSALLQFKESFVMSKNACIHPFAYPKMASWKLEGDNRDCCSWDGVECDEDTGHVIGLDLSNSCLYGSLVFNSSLFRLVQLQRLNLAFNNFSFSQIPSAFSHLSKLTYLNLSESFFSGEIPPKFSELYKLSSLDLSYNPMLHLRSLKGLVQNLTNLRDLRLSYVQISSPVPEILSNLSDLKTLLLIGCGLYGQFPVGIFKLPKLQNLRVGYNQDLMGYLPEFYSSHPLKILGAMFTSFSGKLLASIGNLDSLNVLLIGDCDFSGHIPPSLGFDYHLVNFPWPQLQVLDFRSNKLQALPQNPPPSISVYLVADNEIQGEISPFICNLSSINYLDFSNNKFRGILPRCLSNLSNSLNILNLRGNNFHGMIPQLCAKGSRMRMIDFSKNQFEGVLPRSLSNCRMLEILNFGSNQLNDVFPSWLGALPELKVLILRHNKFIGVVGSPTTIFASPKLHIVDLSSNKFTGKLPFEYFQNWKSTKKVDAYDFTYMQTFTSIRLGNFWVYEFYPYSMTIINKGNEMVYLKIIEVFAAIDLSSNKFNGNIPEFIGNLNGFHLLNLSNNNLTGHIPLSLGNLTTLESLDLSQNKLSGWIPWQLTQLTFLESFNVSHNQAYRAYTTW
uniref:Leucine-rich repeat-containing N-terminal plant-type domain-containing protein n=1 Tax=Fagus sylvatica TaxID=28930 RepID=A0A2N9FN02_FAGSY